MLAESSMLLDGEFLCANGWWFICYAAQDYAVLFNQIVGEQTSTQDNYSMSVNIFYRCTKRRTILPPPHSYRFRIFPRGFVRGC